MDISAVSPDALVKATLRDRQSMVELEAKVGLLKDAQKSQGDAIMALLGAIPTPAADPRAGNNIDVMV